MQNQQIITNIVQQQRKLEHKRWAMLFIFLACGLVGLVLDVMTGPAMLSVQEVLHALFRLDDVDKITLNIVNDLLLPMALMALVVSRHWVWAERKSKPCSITSWQSLIPLDLLRQQALVPH